MAVILMCFTHTNTDTLYLNNLYTNLWLKFTKCMFLSLQCIFIDFLKTLYILIWFSSYVLRGLRCFNNLVFCLQLLNRHPKQKLNRMFLLETHKFLYNKKKLQWSVSLHLKMLFVSHIYGEGLLIGNTWNQKTQRKMRSLL